jgi:Icc-related predicted phosphoesterase
MKLITISDTHNYHHAITRVLPDGDVLVHAGDLTSVGSREEVEDVLSWLQLQAPRYTYGIVFICGNHDRSFDPKFNIDKTSKPTWLIDLLAQIQSEGKVHYLENNETVIDGIKFWGSPITPWFHGDKWAFNEFRGPDIQKVWNKIPLDTDVVITHGPVAYKRDYTMYDRQYGGCEDLRKACKKVKPKLHITGHIHEGYGYEYDEHTLYVNTSTCNLYYRPLNKPWEIEINEEATLIY